MFKNINVKTYLICFLLVALPVTLIYIYKSHLKMSAIPLDRMVHLVTPTEDVLKQNIRFFGFVEPQSHLSLHFLIPGKVTDCSAKAGQPVKKGDLLCSLDTSLVDLEVQRASQAMKSAKNVMETNLADKQKQLFEAGVIGQAEFEQVRIQYEQAKAAYQDAHTLYEMALKKREEHFLRAPTEGKVSKISAAIGSPIAPNLPAVFFSSNQGMRIKAEIHASYFSRMSSGNVAILKGVSSQKLKKEIPLILSEKSSVISPTTQTFEVSFLPHGSESLSQYGVGIIVSGVVSLDETPKSLVIPETALHSWQDDGSASVFVLNSKNELTLKQISVGLIAEGKVQIISGLEKDDHVVGEIAPDFYEGMKVRSL